MSSLVLPETCDRAAAKALYPELCDALGPNRLDVDAGEVARIGQAMLQLLVSAQRSDGGIQITKASQPFKAAIALAGLEDCLGEELSQ